MADSVSRTRSCTTPSWSRRRRSWDSSPATSAAYSCWSRTSPRSQPGTSTPASTSTSWRGAPAVIVGSRSPIVRNSTSCWAVNRRSDSARYRRTSSVRVRADAFQSMSFTSSPRTYSRRSLKSMPRPTWIAAYSPSSRPRTFRWAWMERRALMRVRCAVTGRLGSRCRYGAEHRVDDALGLHPVGQGLEAEVDPVAEHGVPQLADVLGDDVVPALDDSHRAGGLEEGDAAARAG